MMKREAQHFLSAIQFLTRLPTPEWTGWEEGRMDRAAPHFALVGILLGAVIGVAYAVATLALSPLVAALLAIGAGILLTGGLHEDGLADFADGTGGGRDPARVLAIMKDSSIGAYGALALIVVLGLKVCALAALPPSYAIAALVAAHGLSRAGLFATVKALNYARDPDDAKVAPIGRALVRGEILRTALFAALALVPVALLALLVPWRLPGLFLALVAATGSAAYIVARMKARVGGWTGDTLGAQQQITETAFLIGASAWIST